MLSRTKQMIKENEEIVSVIKALVSKVTICPEREQDSLLESL